MADAVARSVPLWRSAAFLIIVIAGCFHLGRGAPTDGAIFLGVAATLLVAEAAVRPPRTPLTLRVPHSWTLTVVAVAAALGWVIGHWRAGTVPVAVAVAVPGPPMLLLALRVGGTGPRTSVPRGWWRWALAGVLICLWELAAFLQQPDAATGSYDHPTLSVILEPAFGAGPVRATLFAGWLIAGVVLCRIMLTERKT